MPYFSHKTNAIKVSIVLPFKNASRFLNECIDSIRIQKHTDWQLIAVDDHSCDNSKAIIESYQDKRINIIKNKGKGILKALQTAHTHIEGDYVTRMDADDIMPANKLYTLLKTLQNEHNGVIATGNIKYFGEQEISEGYQRYEAWLNKTTDQQTFFKNIYRECVVASPNWMIRKKDFDNMQGFDKLTYPEDYDMVFHWRKAGFLIKSCHQLTHLWREHPNRTSRNSKVYQQESFFRLKLGYFLEEFNKKELFLIGTKKKGILIAKMLQKRRVEFRWFAQAPHLIGQKKNNVALENISVLPPGGVCILSIYPEKKERQRLKNFVEKRGYYIGKTAHFF